MRSVVIFSLVLLSLIVESQARRGGSYRSSGGGDGGNGWIAGVVGAGIAFLAGIITLIIICCVCKKKTGTKGGLVSPQANNGVPMVGGSNQTQTVAFQNNQAYSSGFQYDNYSAYPPQASGMEPPPSYSQPDAAYPTKH